MLRKYTFSLIGNLIEWYDFGLFIYYAKEINATFFPYHNQYQRFFFSIFTFALALIVRPLGGIIFGKIGDLRERYLGVNLAIYGMSLVVLVLAVLPGYNIMGSMAIASLLLLRVLQGLFVGGQVMGTLTNAVELPGNYPALNVNVAYSVSMLGFLLAVSVAYVLKYLLVDAVWLQWRVAFMLGGVLGLVFNIYLSRLIKLQPHFRLDSTKSSFIAMLKQQWVTAMVVIILNTFSVSFR